ncbi:MAG: OmpA family protein [Colwellia sp.]|nr:OmpA family protein [Colwellia sp.]
MSPLCSWKNAKSCSLFLLFTAFLFNAIAEDSLADLSHNNSKYNQQGEVDTFYLGAKLGVNRYQHACEAWRIDCDSEDIAGGFLAGYQFNDIFAFEVAYLNLGEASATYLETGLIEQYIGKMQGVELSAVALMPITDDFSAFLKAGTLFWDGENNSDLATIKADGWAPTAGLGLSYQLSDAWQARVEYQYFHELGNDNLGSSNNHLTTLGIVYRFGATKKAVKQKKKAPAPIEQTAVTKPQPIVLPPVVLPKQSFNLLFAFDDSKLLLPKRLTPVVSQLKQYRQSKVLLKGYTDSKGSKSYNFELSKRRVDSVSHYLVTQGVNPEQISSNYFGAQSPFIDNLTPENRSKNRRVLLVVPPVTLKQEHSVPAIKEGAAK